MNAIVRKYGIRSGLIMVVISWLSFFVTRGMSPAVWQIMSFVAIFTGFVPLVQAMRAKRREGGGQITFWSSFFTGALTGVIAAGIMFISTVVFTYALRGAFKEWASGGAGEAVVMNPVEQGIIMFLLILFFASIVSLVGSIFVSSASKADS